MPGPETELLEETRRLTEEMRRLGDLMGPGRRGRPSGEIEYDPKYRSAKEAGVNALKSFKDAVLSTESGLTKYNDAINSSLSSVSMLSKSFGLYGKAIGFTIDVINKLATTVLRFDQSALSATDALSSIGAVGTFTTDELRKMAITAGYNDKKIGEFADIIKSSGESIITLGAGASDSVKKFAEIMTLPEPLKQRFRDLGFNIEKANKFQALYIKTMVAGGSAFTDSIDAIRRQSVMYTKNLIELAALTGKDVETLAKEQEAAAADLQIQLEFMKIDEKINNARTDQERERYQKEKANLLAVSTIAKEFGYVGQDLSAFMQLGLTGTVTDLNEKIFQLLPELPKYVQGMQQGTVSQGQLIKYLSDETRKMGTNFNDFIKLVPEFATQVGLGSKQFEAAGKFANKTAKELDNAVATTGRIITDPAKEMRNRFEEMERQIQRAVDMFVQMISGPIRWGLNKFLDMILATVRGVAKFTDFVGLTSGLYVNVMEGKEAEQLRGQTITEQKDLENVIARSRSRIDELGEKSRLSKAEEREVARLKLEIEQAEREIENKKTLVSTLDETKKMREEINKLNTILSPTISQKPTTSTDSGTQKLLDFISKFESKGNYNVLAGGEQADLTGMSIKEVMDFQSNRPLAKSAAGKYQIMKDTLAMLIKKGVVSPEEKFTPETQEKLGLALLKHRGLDDYLSGKIDIETFMDNLSKEWAALPYKTGKSFYEGSINKALTSRSELKSMIPGADFGGAFFGSSQGYPVMLHGNEMVIPMNNITAPKKFELSSLFENVTENTNISTTQSNITTSGLEMVVSLLSEKLDMVIDKLERSVDTEEQILQYSRFRS